MNSVDKAYHHGNLQEALLDAVGEIIAERGVGAVSLREAARRAGVSHSAPAHHFGDKLGLLTGYATRGFALFAARMESAVAAVEDPHERINALGFAYLTFAMEQRAYFEVMFRSEMHNDDNPDFQAASDRAFGVLMRVAEEVPPEAFGIADPEIIAMKAWAMVHGMATLWHDGALQEFWDGSLPDLAAAVFADEF